MIMKESSGRSPRAGAVRRGRLGASSSGSESESDSATSDEVLASLNAFRKLSTQDLFDQAAKVSSFNIPPSLELTLFSTIFHIPNISALISKHY